jgi:MauM/NapG family ferredoxin protein
LIPRKGYLRWLVRVVLLVAAVVTLLPVFAVTRLPLIVPALSPFVAIASVVATRSLSAIAGIGLAVAAVAVVRRRWFCRWVCPTGTCADAVTRIGVRLGRRCPRVISLGQWIAWITLGGAVVGYPLFLWLDPLAVFAGSFSVGHAAASSAGVWSALGLAAILVLSALWPGLWCSRVCPLGALQDSLAGCGRLLRRIAPRSEPAVHPEAVRGWPRRTVLGAMAGIGWALVVRPRRTWAGRPLRPPGALDEAEFVGVCIRCGNCLRVCPADIVRPDQGKYGIAGLLTPTLDFQDDYCREDCVRCTQVCPSGALTTLALDDKRRASIGFPKVDMNVCLRGDDQECSLCRNWCPYEAIQFVFNEEDYTHTPHVDPQRCNGCGACENACPTAPAKSIVVVPPFEKPSVVPASAGRQRGSFRADSA